MHLRYETVANHHLVSCYSSGRGPFLIDRNNIPCAVSIKSIKQVSNQSPAKWYRYFSLKGASLCKELFML